MGYLNLFPAFKFQVWRNVIVEFILSFLFHSFVAEARKAERQPFFSRHLKVVLKNDLNPISLFVYFSVLNIFIWKLFKKMISILFLFSHFCLEFSFLVYFHLKVVKQIILILFLFSYFCLKFSFAKLSLQLPLAE